MDNLENKEEVEQENFEEVEAAEPVEKKKFSTAFSAFAQKTADFGKKAADGMQKGAKAFSEKMKQDSYERRKKKYNPITMKEFKSKSFNLPNVIKIVDDAVRKGIDVCEGAIGWLGAETGTEVLYLYDEVAKEMNCGVEFYPNAECDQVYCVDKFKRNKFIKVDTVFERSHEERLAELEQIAYSLGAKSCLINIEYAEVENAVHHVDSKAGQHSDVDGKVCGNKSQIANHQSAELKQSLDVETQREQRNYRSGKARTYFSGNAEPVCPNLKWFEKDDSIRSLIEMRCSSKNAIKSRRLVLEGSTSRTMSMKMANTIDALLEHDMTVAYKKINVKNKHKTEFHHSISMATKAIRESSSKLIFDVEFE